MCGKNGHLEVSTADTVRGRFVLRRATAIQAVCAMNVVVVYVDVNVRERTACNIEYPSRLRWWCALQILFSSFRILLCMRLADNVPGLTRPVAWVHSFVHRRPDFALVGVHGVYASSNVGSPLKKSVLRRDTRVVPPCQLISAYKNGKRATYWGPAGTHLRQHSCISLTARQHDGLT